MLDQLLVGALGARRGGLEQHDALAELAGEVVLAGLELAPQLVAPRGEHVRPGLDRPLPAARAVDHERAAPAHAVVVRVERVQLGLGPLAVAGAAVQDDRAELLVAVAEDVAETSTRSPTVRLAGYLPASTTGWGYWMWIRGGACGALGHRGREYPLARVPQTSAGS